MGKHRLLCAAALLFCLAGGAHAANGHDHGHEADAPTKLQLDGGKKWPTDAPLRQAMSDINQAMAKALPLIHKNQLSDALYQVLADTVGRKLAFAVENCKLDAKADTMLHLIFADLLDGAEAMSEKATRSRHNGAVQVLLAPRTYGQYFQHPGWRTAKG